MAGIDFSVRPNKSIERKYFVECLFKLSTNFPISRYKYIGFGSFWFVDFVMFHKRLGISKMTSIERSDLSDRASFNVPLKCIKVESGDSTLVLPHLAFDNRTLLWLDYDKDLDGPWRDDAEIVLGRLEPGAIFIVTVNAAIGQLRKFRNAAGEGSSKLEALEAQLPGLVPPGTSNSDLDTENFPIVVGDILINLFKRLVRRADPSRKFKTILNFRYADNAAMVTVGGMIIDDETEDNLGNCELEQCSFLTGEAQYKIDAPPLTLKEKHALDRLLPKKAPLRTDEIPTRLREALGESGIRGYQEFYLQYPVFAEIND